VVRRTRRQHKLAAAAAPLVPPVDVPPAKIRAVKRLRLESFVQEKAVVNLDETAGKAKKASVVAESMDQASIGKVQADLQLPPSQGLIYLFHLF
jgi:hypothetical protein